MGKINKQSLETTICSICNDSSSKHDKDGLCLVVGCICNEFQKLMEQASTILKEKDEKIKQIEEEYYQKWRKVNKTQEALLESRQKNQRVSTIE